MDNTQKKFININSSIVLSEMIVEVKPPSSSIHLESFVQEDNLVEEPVDSVVAYEEAEADSFKEQVTEEMMIESVVFLEKAYEENTFEQQKQQEKEQQKETLEKARQFFMRKQQLILQRNNIKSRMRSRFSS